MTLAHGDDVVLLQQRFAVEGGLVNRRKDGEHDVAGATGEGFERGRSAVPGLDDQVDAGRGAGERPVQRAGDDDAGVIGGDDAHGPADFGKGLLRRIDDGGDAGEQGLQRIAQGFGLRRQAHAALAALQQGIVEQVAAAVERAGRRRLGEVQPGGGARDMRLVQQRIQHDEEVEVDRS